MHATSRTNRARILALTTILAALVTAAVAAAHQQPPPAIPGVAEMAKLHFYLGDWDYTETYPASPFAPNGGVNTGVYSSKLGPGGNSLINTFHSKGPVGDFEGILIITWDAKANEYKQIILGNDFPGYVLEGGHFDGAGALVFSGEMDSPAGKFSMRTVSKRPAANKITSQEFLSIPGKPDSLLVTVEATKR